MLPGSAVKLSRAQAHQGRPHPYHSFGPAPNRGVSAVKVTRVTVSDRQAPPEPAPYGTQLARPAGQAGRSLTAA
jgi:hypothetical protein